MPYPDATVLAVHLPQWSAVAGAAPAGPGGANGVSATPTDAVSNVRMADFRNLINWYFPWVPAACAGGPASPPRGRPL
ncbi:hypothetical protein [Nocardia otitidiscaviarum]|uniref:hypothetical protein n=1 Tax=Nocardia otitidiscaviarum TaxID=1823 RepID=UPI001E461294|nr:hypothetical protein [Nocardia otitidiscaviarum]